VKESDIRRSDILNKYLELCNEDAIIYFNDCPREDILCPGV